MSEEDALRRLKTALGKIDARIRAAEARPSREEIEALKEARQGDLHEIKELRAKIQAALKEYS